MNLCGAICSTRTTSLGAKDAHGHITEVHDTVFSGTKSGTPNVDNVEAKAAITWEGASDGVQAEVRLIRPVLDAHGDAFNFQYGKNRING